MSASHTEQAFEDAIEAHLLSHSGYTKGDPSKYDRERALIIEDVIAFVSTTQKKNWGKLRDIHKDKLEDLFIEALCKNLKNQGCLNVLRHGFKFYGKTIKLAYFAPAHGLNPEVEAQYEANKLSVIRQLYYDPNNKNSLDLVLFLNGIPVVTAELKNAMTGQTVQNSKQQYRKYRSPNAPIFKFKERALVHFAVDTDEVYMTTRLRKEKTFFLPFNKGNGTAAGNPVNPNGHKTAYLWEEVWQRDSLLDIIGRFMHLQVEEEENDKGVKKKKETMIFPRYHQLDAVRKLICSARLNGAGTNYLVQHSAGSGKSNSIAWVAHRLSSLHDDDDKKVYNCVIVLTDRTVLDQQLQDTIYQFDHKSGVVEKVDKDSQQLADALTGGIPIIISTIHKFGFIQEKIKNLPDRRYALIVDEAHSSQSGEMALNVKKILSDSERIKRLVEDEDDLSTPDQDALRQALERGPQPNMSFFAFTATPKYKTLKLFNHTGDDDNPAPFHLYSMRQAIEEGFILDVLKGYTTYKSYFKLIKQACDDPEFEQKKANKALARFLSLHPHNVRQKIEVIVEHFQSVVRHRLGGKAKAMILTGSRLHAVRFKEAFDKYVVEKNYSDLRALVAFSGVVEDDEVKDKTYTEEGMNCGVKETELPKKFKTDEYKVLIVADKYQTGFDEPLLCAMYVDKRLNGIQAVQTLSRLNRMYPGKEQTFVLDFVNERDGILESFKPYFEQTAIDEPVDPQRLYELQTKLDSAQIYWQSEVDSFAAIFFKPKTKKSVTDHYKLNNALDPAVDRFTSKEEAEQDEFRGTLTSYVRLYAFFGQIIPFHDQDLEKLYAFGRMLLRKLPKKGEKSPPVELGEDVGLKYYRLQKLSEGSIDLKPGEGTTISGPGEVGSGTGKVEKVTLSHIIDIFNERFGTEFKTHHLVGAAIDTLVDSEKMQQAAAVNGKENFGLILKPALEAVLLDQHEKNEQFIDAVYDKPDMLQFLFEHVNERVFRKLKGESRWQTITKTLVNLGYMHSRLEGRKDAVPYKPEATTNKDVSKILLLAVDLCESTMPVSFAGTKYPPNKLASLSDDLLRLLDLTEKELTKGLDKNEKNSLAKTAASFSEPFYAKVLGVLEEESLIERMNMYKKKKRPIGLVMLLQLLDEKGRANFEKALFTLDSSSTDGWEALNTLSNSVRDLLALRMDTAHTAPPIPTEKAIQAAWCAICVVFSIIEKNQEELRERLGLNGPNSIAA